MQVVEAARSAATAAAAEENSKYEVQIKDLAAQLQVPPTSHFASSRRRLCHGRALKLFSARCR